MAKRQRHPAEMDDKNMNRGEDTEDRDAQGRFTSEGGHDNLDDEDTDTGTTRSKSMPPKKK